MTGMRKSCSRVLRGAAAVAAVGMATAVLPATASADATDDYPIPHRMIITTCTAEQIMAAARDVKPIYYTRYMIDYNNKPADVQQAARDYVHWFYSQTPEARRAWSEEMATNIYSDPLVFRWPNHAKLFFNNKGVAARTTDVCEQYPPDDMSVWHWS